MACQARRAAWLLELCAVGVHCFDWQSSHGAVDTGAAALPTQQNATKEAHLLGLIAGGRLHSGTARMVTEATPFRIHEEVRHYKDPSGGYRKGSPLYEKQEQLGAYKREDTEEEEEPRPSAPPSVEAAKAAVEVANGSQEPGIIVPPVSTAFRCMVNLIALFLFTYTAHVFAAYVGLQGRVKRIVETVRPIPMLCVLFLLARARAVQLAGGDPDPFGLPQWWLRAAMVACTWTLSLMTTVVIVAVALFGADWEELAPKRGHNSGVRWLFRIRNFLFFAAAAFFAVVCAGICAMSVPGNVWWDGSGHVDPALKCTTVLAVAYSIINLLYEGASVLSRSGLAGDLPVEDMMEKAVVTIQSIPMLCVLFISVRLRELQVHAAQGGSPHYSLHALFYLCTVSVIIQIGLSLAGAYLDLELMDDDVSECSTVMFDTGLDYQSKSVGFAHRIVNAALYVGLLPIIYYVFAMRLDVSPESTPALPTSLFCVVMLTLLYFAVHLAKLVCLTVDNLGKNVDRLQVFLKLYAMPAVAFAPAFGVLCVAALLRAEQLTAGRGAPQRWAQDAMMYGVCALVVCTVSRIDTLSTTQSKSLALIGKGVNAVFVLVVFASTMAIVVALHGMTPENASGHGASLYGFEDLQEVIRTAG